MSGQEWTQGLSRPKAAINLAIALCAVPWGAIAKEHPRQDWYRVNVLVISRIAAPTELLKGGQEAASTIYAGIHVELMWTTQKQHNAATHRLEETPTYNVTVEVVHHPPAGFSDAALAAAMPYADSGVRIVIFYDRVEPLLHGHHAPQATVLGYVLAHEIAHVLQGVVRHSEVGIMRASWTDNDFNQMSRRVLLFTTEDVQLIRSRLAPRGASVVVPKC